MKRPFWVLVLISIVLLSSCCTSITAPTPPIFVAPVAAEASVGVIVEYKARGGNGTFDWKVIKGVGEPTTGQGPVFRFTPRQKGQFSILVTSGTASLIVGGGA